MSVAAPSFTSTKPHPSASSSTSDATPVGASVHTLSIAVHTLDAVMDVLTTLARLGATIEKINANEGKVEVSYQARKHVAARVPSLIQSLVSVTDVRVHPVHRLTTK